jgi:hypothetical protein
MSILVTFPCSELAQATCPILRSPDKIATGSDLFTVDSMLSLAKCSHMVAYNMILASVNGEWWNQGTLIRHIEALAGIVISSRTRLN